MKKLIFSFAVAIISFSAFSQNYSQVGAIGHYNINGVGPFDRLYATLETVKDTNINSFACQKLEETQYGYNGSQIKV